MKPSSARPLRRLCVFAALFALLVPACRTATATSSDPDTQTVQGPISSTSQIPENTELRVSLNQKLDTESTQKGDIFSATLLNPLMSESGEVVVPATASVSGQVTGVAPSTSANEQAAIRLDIQEIRFDGRAYPMSADITQTGVESHADSDELRTGAAVGGVTGLALGAIIGRSVTSAVVGGLLGAGAGTAISMGTGTTNAELPAGSTMTLRTTRAVPIQ